MKSFQTRNEIQLQEVGDDENKNLLIIASISNRLPEVQKLIAYEFDVDFDDINSKNAIDHAWEVYENSSSQHEEDKSSKIILKLLEANSTYPMDFEYAIATKELQNFVDICESMHECVDSNDFDGLKDKLSSHPTLAYIYNSDNQSLLSYALKKKKYEIVKYLDKGFTIGSFEELAEVFEYVKKDEVADEIRMKNLENVRNQPESHLLVLQLCSKIGSNDRLFYKHWIYVREAYAKLNSNQYCSKILKVIAECETLQIIFDFIHDTIFYLNPTRQPFTMGTTHPNGTIYIGAKYLMYENKKFEVLGTMAHEFAHLAMHMTYMNGNFDPFPSGGSQERIRFVTRVMPQCEKQKNDEDIINNVYKYEKDLQNSEMIVTVPQMMMKYAENPEKIRKLEGIFKELFKYSREVVEPELEKAQIAFRMLNNEKQKLKFNDLSQPMKAKILHGKIKFQGEETTFLELIGRDSTPLQFLLNDEIRQILCKSEILEIYKIDDQVSKHELIDRSYIRTKSYEKICENDRSNREKMDIESWINAHKMTLEDIQLESVSSKTFILADRAGTGKTTSFEDAARKLKQNKNVWTYFINLRKNVQVFEKFAEFVGPNFKLPQVLQILSNFIGNNSKIEIAMFVHLFLEGKLTFLFDGVDEVSPKYTELLEQIFMFLKKFCIKNQLWISTRPHYVKRLENLLGCCGYQFTPYTNDEKKDFIKKVLQHKKINNSLEQDRISQEIIKYISQLDLGLVSTQQIDNSLMLRIVSELFVDSAFSEVKAKGKISSIL